jgi:uncharacterized membrane protein YphA (DoxX/SURF4 family)
MDTIVLIIQILIALGIYNVWLVRFGRSTSWRGGTAQNLKEEFAVYGLPPWVVLVVGFFKLLCATLLIVGLWVPVVTKPAAVGMAVLMLGAVTMHFKVSDPPKRALPAFTMLVLSVIVAVAGGTALPGLS